jgi:hypothetical protein
MRLRVPRRVLWSCLVAAIAGNAAAQRVALVRPEGQDEVLVDAFNRLGAELRIHRFETQVVDLPVAEDPSRVLAEVARREHALASIAFLHRNGKTTVDLWLVDRVSGKTTMRTIQVRKGADASSVLAIRAVDLLRASLGEFEPGERPPPDVREVDPGPVPPAVEALALDDEPNVMVRAEGMLLAPGPRYGVAYGPEVGLYASAGDFAFGLHFAGPLVGASLDTPKGSASVTEEIVALEGRALVARTPRLDVGVSVNAGAFFLQAEGRAEPPLRSKSASEWSLLGGAGVHSDIKLLPRLAIGLSLRALGLFPRVGVAVDTESELLGMPLVAASLGVRVGL